MTRESSSPIQAPSLPSPEAQRLSAPSLCLWTLEHTAQFISVTLSTESLWIHPHYQLSQKTWLFFNLFRIYPFIFFFLMMPDFYTRKGRRRMQSSENEPPAPAGTAAGPCGWGMATGGRCGARWAWAVQSPGTALGQGFCGHSLSQARDNHHLCQAHSATSEAAASVPTLTFKRGQLQQEYEQTFFWAPSFFFFSSCFFFFFSSIKCSSSCVSCSFSLIKTKVRKSFSVRWSFSRKVNNPYLHC